MRLGESMGNTGSGAGERPWLAFSGARTRLMFALALALWAVLSYFVVIQTGSNEDPFHFVAARSGSFRVLTENDFALSFTAPALLNCVDPERCHIALRSMPLKSLRAFHDEPPALDLGFNNANEWRSMRVVFTLQTNAFKTPYTGVSADLHLPRMRFQQADVYIDGQHVKRVFSGDHLLVPLDAASLSRKTISGEVILQLMADDAKAFINWGEPTFLTDMVGQGDYLDFLRRRDTSPARQIGDVVRVAMALFVLLLFLIIESSDEALGLALTMGFHALSLLVGFADLRRTWLPDGINLTFVEYASRALADSFQLFFFLHLAKVGRFKAARWFSASLVYAIPYALVLFFSLPYGWTWQRYLIGGSEGVVAALGLAVCLYRAYTLRHESVPFRMGSLLLASAAALCQLGDLLWNYPGELGSWLGASTAVGQIIAVAHTNGSYLLAMSMFVNISTLENRVRTLSLELVKSQELERDLELGRTVQRAFMLLPELPPSVGVETYHEAALYVSGDTYFAHWHHEKQRFVCLLNDVTGHGVHAALKAFACTVVARSIWRDSPDETPAEQLRRYDESINALVNGEGEGHDFSALVGVELNALSGEVKLYRVNYHGPLILEPGLRGWSIRALAMPNRQIVHCTLRPGSLIVLISDGILSDPRSQRSLVRYLDTAVKARSRDLAPAEVKVAILAWLATHGKRIVDDKTFLVLKWTPEAMESRLPRAV